MPKTVLILFILATTVDCGATSADVSRTTEATRTVRFQDLDLAKMADVTVLYRRLLQAARALCEPRPNPSVTISAQLSAGIATCVDQSMDAAVIRIRSPLLTQYRKSLDRRSGASGPASR
jgi:UrcA family protein